MSAVAPGETSKGAKRRSTWIVALLTAWNEFEVSLTDLVELCRREDARMVAFTHTRLW